jgi:hypothetical protein
MSNAALLAAIFIFVRQPSERWAAAEEMVRQPSHRPSPRRSVRLFHRADRIILSDQCGPVAMMVFLLT